MVVLDIGLPGIDGISICRTVRDDFEGPILILTARGDEIDEVVALEVGADDYMSKPVGPHALLARLRVHLRRAGQSGTEATTTRISVDDLLIDTTNRSVSIGDHNIDLTTAEFDLLWLLAKNAGKVIPRDELYQELHGVRYDGLDRSIDLRVSRLRKKIGDDPVQPQRTFRGGRRRLAAAAVGAGRRARRPGARGGRRPSSPSSRPSSLSSESS